MLVEIILNFISIKGKVFLEGFKKEFFDSSKKCNISFSTNMQNALNKGKRLLPIAHLGF